MSDAEIEFGKFPKAKYILNVNNRKAYYFVTTARSENDCVEALKEKAKTCGTRVGRNYYSIYKEINNETNKIYSGFF